jgi:hypothetical protein
MSMAIKAGQEELRSGRACVISLIIGHTRIIAWGQASQQATISSRSLGTWCGRLVYETFNGIQKAESIVSQRSSLCISGPLQTTSTSLSECFAHDSRNKAEKVAGARFSQARPCLNLDAFIYGKSFEPALLVAEYGPTCGHAFSALATDIQSLAVPIVVFASSYRDGDESRLLSTHTESWSELHRDYVWDHN